LLSATGRAAKGSVTQIKQPPRNLGRFIFLRELIIAFGASGHVALFEIDGAETVTVLAVRQQGENDYH